MRKIIRSNKLECLEKKSNDWTNDWKKRKEEKRDFYWHKYKNEKVEHIITKELSILTQNHCSYCDIYPVQKGSIKPSIDHFKPKSLFPEQAFEWRNLFLSCLQCQEYKGNNYPENIKPLKPDHKNFSFDYWFEIDWKTNEIKPNSIRKSNEIKIAQTTIDFLGLNRDSRPIVRKNELKKYKDSLTPIIDDWSYRFYLERG